MHHGSVTINRNLNLDALLYADDLVPMAAIEGDIKKFGAQFEHYRSQI